MKVSMEGMDVMLGIPAGRDFDPLTVKSLVATFAACQRRNVPIRLDMVANCSVIEWARDEVMDHFLSSSCNTLFLIDSDMVWEAEQFLRMLVLSRLYPVVCAAYPAKKDDVTFYLNYDATEMQPNEMGLMEIYGVGLGFTVIRREVAEALAGKAGRVRDGVSGKEMAGIHRIDSPHGERRGEDMAFFADIRDLGYKVLLDPSIDLGHVGRKVYRGSIKAALASQ